MMKSGSAVQPSTLSQPIATGETSVATQPTATRSRAIPGDPIVVMQETLRLRTRARKGANWFFGIAVLSFGDTVLGWLGGRAYSMFALGTTRIVSSALGHPLVRVRFPHLTPADLFVIAVTLVVSAVLALFGLLARRGIRWAFIIGAALYATDTLLLLPARDVLGIAFHALALYAILRGMIAAFQLAGIAQVKPQAHAANSAA